MSNKEKQTYHFNFEGKCWPNPNTDLEWQLRYGDEVEKVRMLAASVVSAYKHLIWSTQRIRNENIKCIRKMADDLR